MDDFSKPKIVYPDIMRMPLEEALLKDYPKFHLDTEGFFPEATLFLLTGNDIQSLVRFLCSDVGFWAFSKIYTGPQFDSTGFRYKKEYIATLPVPHSDSSLANGTDEAYANWLAAKLRLTAQELKFIDGYKARLVEQKRREKETKTRTG